MGYAERNTWAQVISSIIAAAVYAVVLIPRLRTQTAHEVQWVQPMLWTIVASIVASIVLSIGIGIVAGMINPDTEHRADLRDQEIDRFGNRIGQAFLIAGSLGALTLTMVRADWFWIGNTLFAGFILFTVVGGIARLIAYRRGFQ
ncbi:hypothetical protein [Nesterenkonia ebinurensis]|uniref:hypothetical protein n=1 Tax=Nesterenkonia ebinurensis TaxID=2608252 RepID=UPI00123E37B1|nr:hypothetical protein [Nesterenkonia ebinurensis]